MNTEASFEEYNVGQIVCLKRELWAENGMICGAGEAFQIIGKDFKSKVLHLESVFDNKEKRQIYLYVFNSIMPYKKAIDIDAYVKGVLQKFEEQATTTPFEIPSESLPKFDEGLQQNIDEGFVEGKKSFEYIWQELGKSFDWARVHKMMLAVEWYWSFGNDQNGVDQMGIPCIKTIQSYVYSLLKRAYDEDLTSCSSGCFVVGWDGDEMYITFIAEQDSILGKTTF